MGIMNRQGALFMATGIDNTGLFRGKKEAIGILKSMAREITSFDVFGGIGISAGVAFAKAAKDSYEFEKQFQKSMTSVATISDYVTEHMEDTKNKIISLTTDKNIPVGANEMADALYQIVSAGHDGADAMTILEQSGKAAVGGMTETATAADAITTLLNAYKQDASQAEKVSDMLFTTAKLGKTTFGELGKSISQVAPIAASFGIEMDQVLAAVSTLTKSGVPTAQAMTQIRASIIAANKVLGDGAFNTMTYQEGLQKIAEMAGGSESRLRELVPEIEGMNGILGLTGMNAQAASKDLQEMSSSLGATDQAFKKMADTGENQMKLLKNNITAILRPLGEAALKSISDMAKAFNDAFASGDVQKSMKTLAELVIALTSGFVVYKGAIMASTIQQRIHAAVTEITRYEMALYEAAVKSGTIAENASTVAQIKNTAVRKAMINTIKMHTSALIRNTAATLSNPYVLMAAAIVALGYAFYKATQYMSAAEQEQERLKKRTEEHTKAVQDEKETIDKLIATLENENATRAEKINAFNELKSNYPSVFGNYKTEKDLINDLTNARKKENEQIMLKNKLLHVKDNEEDQQRLKDFKRLLELEKKGEAGRRTTATQGEYEMLFDKYNIDKNKGFSQSRANYLQDMIKETAKTIGNGQGELRKIEQDEWVNSVESMTDEAAKAQKKLYENYLSILKKSGKEWLKISENEAPVNADILQKRIEMLNREKVEVEKRSAQEYRAEAKKAWEDAKKEVEKVKNGKSLYSSEDEYQKELKRKKDLAKAAKERYENLGGETTTKSKDNSALQLKKDTQEYEELLKKQSLEKKRMEEDMQMQIEEGRIRAMEEGSRKTVATIELDYEKQMQAIDRAKEDLLQKKIDLAKAKFEKNPDNKNKIFDDSNISLTKEESDKFNEMYVNSMNEYLNNQKSFEAKSKRQWNEYLKQYGDYQQKRQAIIALYTEKIKNAETEGDKAILAKEMNNALDELDNRVRSSTSLMAQLFADTSDKSVREIEKIIAKAEMLSKYLQSVKDGEGTAIIGNKSVTKGDILNLGISQNALENLSQSPQDIKALADAIKSLKGELGGRSPFLSMKKDISDALDLFKKGGKDNISVGIQKMSQSIGTAGDAISQLGSSISSIFDEETARKIDGISQSIGGLAKSGMGIGQIMSGDIAGGVFSIVQGIPSIIQGISSMFSGSNAKDVEDTTKRLTLANERLRESIDNLRNEMKYAAGALTLERGDKMVKEQERIIKNTSEILGKQMSYHDSHHSNNYNINENLSYSDWRKISRKVGKRVDSAWQLWKLSPEDLAKVRELEGIWEKIMSAGKYDKSQYVNDYLKLAGSIKKIKQETRDLIFGMKYNDFYGDFVNHILDAKYDVENAGKDLGKIFMKAMISNIIGAKMDKELKKLFDDIQDAYEEGNGEITQGQSDSFTQRYQNLVKSAKEQAKRVQEITHQDDEEDKKGTTGKLEASVTEGTATQLVGLWTMSAMDIRFIKENFSEIISSSRDMRLDIGEILKISKQISDNTLRSADNSSVILDKMTNVLRELSDIKINTKQYNGRG